MPQYSSPVGLPDVEIVLGKNLDIKDAMGRLATKMDAAAVCIPVNKKDQLTAKPAAAKNAAQKKKHKTSAVDNEGVINPVIESSVRGERPLLWLDDMVRSHQHVLRQVCSTQLLRDDLSQCSMQQKDDIELVKRASFSKALEFCFRGKVAVDNKKVSTWSSLRSLLQDAFYNSLMDVFAPRSSQDMAAEHASLGSKGGQSSQLADGAQKAGKKNIAAQTFWALVDDIRMPGAKRSADDKIKVDVIPEVKTAPYFLECLAS